MSFRRRLMSGGKKKEYIKFEDPEVERICIANWSSDGVGLTYEDAERVTEINNKHGFKGNTNITSFNELNYFTGLTRLKNGAFYKATNLVIDELNLPNLERLEGGVFNSTKIKSFIANNLTDIAVYGDNTGGTFENCIYLYKLIIPKALYCRQLMCNGCVSLVELDTFSDVTIINGRSFYDTPKLNIPLNVPNLKTIEYGAFGKSGITRVENLGNITALAAAAGNVGGSFRDLENLEFVRLPKTLVSIPSDNFMNCKNLKTVILQSVNPPTMTTGYGVPFSNCNDLLVFYVPDESVEAYKQADVWSQYADRIKPLSEYVEN